MCSVPSIPITEDQSDQKRDRSESHVRHRSASTLPAIALTPPAGKISRIPQLRPLRQNSRNHPQPHIAPHEPTLQQSRRPEAEAHHQIMARKTSRFQGPPESRHPRLRRIPRHPRTLRSGPTHSPPRPHPLLTSRHPCHCHRPASQHPHHRQRRPGLRRRRLPGQQGRRHPAPRRPRQIRGPLHQRLRHLSRLLTLARRPAHRSLPGTLRPRQQPRLRPARQPRRPAPHRNHPPAIPQTRRLSHRLDRQMAPRLSPRLRPMGPRLRRILRLHRRRSPLRQLAA